MSEEEPGAGVLAGIVEALVGSFLAEACGRRLYEALSRVDQQALDELLIAATANGRAMTMTYRLERDDKGDVVCKALTLWQPWASLVVHGLKRFETRSWNTAHRGLLAIHAARRPVSQKQFAQFADLLIYSGITGPEQLPLGAIVGFVCVSGSFPITEKVIKILSDEERRVGDYSPGMYAWPLDGPVWLPEPIPYRGRQGLWTATLAKWPFHERWDYLAGLRYLGALRPGSGFTTTREADE